jgi:hypothetical protein
MVIHDQRERIRREYVESDRRFVMKSKAVFSLLRYGVLSMSLLRPGFALCEDSSDKPRNEIVWAPVKHLQFTDEDVEGGKLGADGELIAPVTPACQPTLIEIRKGFEAEILKTMENF